MDPTPRVWFHAFEEDSMKRLEQLTDRVSVRTAAADTNDAAIRPFRVNVPEAELAETWAKFRPMLESLGINS